MALTEQIVIDKIEVLEDGQIQVRHATRVFRDGVQIAETYHRHVIVPGDDLGCEAKRVADIATVVHTPDVIAAYRLKIARATMRPEGQS